jgi:hypothetical protein
MVLKGLSTSIGKCDMYHFFKLPSVKGLRIAVIRDIQQIPDKIITYGK